jgi:hypothetical protein
MASSAKKQGYSIAQSNRISNFVEDETKEHRA